MLSQLHTILLANPRGFCAGVERAINTVRLALQRLGQPIFVRHEVVHNRQVVDDLIEEGARFVQDLEQVPPGSYVIFSAHGVAPEIFAQAKALGLKILDATCPLVTKVHVEVARAEKNGYEVIVIGHRQHIEVQGTVGYYSDQNKIYVVENRIQAEQLEVANPERLFYVTQTTLSISETDEILQVLMRRFPKLSGPKKKDICYATTNRQWAVKQLLEHADALLVVGSDNSSNSKRLQEMGESAARPSFLIDSCENIPWQALENVQVLAMTAGASAPEATVQSIITALLSARPDVLVKEVSGRQELINFQLPTVLKKEQIQV